MISFHGKTFETYFLILLGLLSFGGATGRFSFGLGLFDFFLLGMLIFSLFKKGKKIFLFKRSDLAIFLSLVICVVWGFLISVFNFGNVKHDFFITELRFFIYIPLIFWITTIYRINLDVLYRILPFLLICYLFLWSVLLIPGTVIFDFFNDDSLSEIGDQERIGGPPIVMLVPILLLLIKEKQLNNLIQILYLALILLIFVKTGARTYFIFYLIPVVFLLYRKRKNLGVFIFGTFLLITSFFFIQEYTTKAFYTRFLGVLNPTEDTSFMYRVFNIEEMVNRFTGETLWTGFGIGSNYTVNLYGWRESFFLDNSFVTLFYKIGLIGFLFFLYPLFKDRKWIPRDIYLFEMAGLLLIGFISYHIILNPVFLFGYFLIFNYYKDKKRQYDA